MKKERCYVNLYIMKNIFISSIILSSSEFGLLEVNTSVQGNASLICVMVFLFIRMTFPFGSYITTY